MELRQPARTGGGTWHTVILKDPVDVIWQFFRLVTDTNEDGVRRSIDKMRCRLQRLFLAKVKGAGYDRFPQSNREDFH